MLDNGKGLMFFPKEERLAKIKKKTHALNQKYNNTPEYEKEERRAILEDMLGEVGENVSIYGPIAFHYGVNTKIGKNTFINFNFVCQDDGEVTIGENCDIGPNVTIVTPFHPMLANERKELLCPDGEKRKIIWAEPVKIGNKCWICASVTILPGVTIGDNCVIGAGSVVNRSIPANTFACGNPCRVVRELSEKDSLKHRPEILGDCSVIEK